MKVYRFLPTHGVQSGESIGGFSQRHPDGRHSNIFFAGLLYGIAHCSADMSSRTQRAAPLASEICHQR